MIDRFRRVTMAIAGMAGIACLMATPARAASRSHGRVPAGAGTIDALIGKMTLAQKVRLLHGEREPESTYQGQGGYLAGIATFGIRPLRFADGPPGVLTRHRSTALTSTMGLAATFSVADAEQNGVVIGRDARALGIDVTLQPFINIMRDPTWVRAYNLYGEDPWLVGSIGAALIRGIQSEGVMAQAKHFIAYDGANDVEVGPQALHEIYAAPFAMAVDAGVASIMCSYDEVNGAHACENSAMLRGLLRGELGFKGFVTSDWGATHSTTAVDAGLDLEMPGSVFAFMPCYFCARPQATAAPPRGGPFFAPSPLPIPEEPKEPFSFGGFDVGPKPLGMLGAVRSGRVAIARIDEAVRRILTQAGRFAPRRGAGSGRISAVPFARDLPIVEKTSEDAAVLLKNDGHILPLRPGEPGTLLLIGPGAGQTITVGQSGEKALGFPDRDESPLQAVRRVLGPRARGAVRYAVADDMTGVPVPAADLSHDGRPGLVRIDRSGRVLGIDAAVDFTDRTHAPLPAGAALGWRGTLAIPRTGTYWINLQLLGCAAKLRVDGKPTAISSNLTLHGDTLQAAQDNVLPTTDGLDDVRVALSLAAGAHSIGIEERPDGSHHPVQIRLSWSTPPARHRLYRAALAAARRAHTVVVFAWSRGRPAYRLPGDQDRLIAAVAAINPRTIVVLNSDQPVALPWLDRVRALLEMWYPGDGGGPATADILTGRADPAGRLPFTWARRLDQYVSHDPRHPERSSRGIGGVTRYSEGIFVGYRWFDHRQLDPRFPFGYGLSYTHFRYGGLEVSRAIDGGLLVRFTIRNTGTVSGDEVPQVYLGPPTPRPADAQFAARALVGFDRVEIAPGQRATLRIAVPRRELQYWNVRSNAWRIAPGRRMIEVGASERDLRLRGPVPADADSRGAPAASPTVTVPQGRLIGRARAGVDEFLGVPYAAPPIGANRWRAPQPLPAWTGVRAARRFAPSCMQPYPPPTFGPFTREFVQTPAPSEDCLYLNVWTRSLTARQPVFVWIHGGGFIGGSGAVPIYAGSRLAAKGAVVVTINYRLGPFGFLVYRHRDGSRGDRLDGNFGLQDEIAALRWVKANIARFGGDPGNVTIAGQSAGAISVDDLLVSPQAKGLFQRAIAESGSAMGLGATPWSAAERDGRRFAAYLGVHGVAALRALPASRIQAAVYLPMGAAPVSAHPPAIRFEPVVDGRWLPQDPERTLASVRVDVPLLTGFNRDENPPVGPVTQDAFRRDVIRHYGAQSTALLALYPHATDAQATTSARRLARDRYMASLIIWARHQAGLGSRPIYLYRFDHAAPVAQPPAFGAFHSAEVPYVFGVLNTRDRPYGAVDRRISNRIQAYWLNFARRGDPNGPGLPAWAAATVQAGTVMGLGRSSGAERAVSNARRLAVLIQYAETGGSLSLF